MDVTRQTVALVDRRTRAALGKFKRKYGDLTKAAGLVDAAVEVLEVAAVYGQDREEMRDLFCEIFSLASDLLAISQGSVLPRDE